MGADCPAGSSRIQSSPSVVGVLFLFRPALLAWWPPSSSQRPSLILVTLALPAFWIQSQAALVHVPTMGPASSPHDRPWRRCPMPASQPYGAPYMSTDSHPSKPRRRTAARSASQLGQAVRRARLDDRAEQSPFVPRDDPGPLHALCCVRSRRGNTVESGRITPCLQPDLIGEAREQEVDEAFLPDAPSKGA